jgi:ankyrin repeat protein
LTNISVTAWLLEHGADPNLTNHSGLTPLELVCAHRWDYWDKKTGTNRIVLLQGAGTRVTKPGFETLSECLEKLK